MPKTKELEEIEISLLLEGIFRRYGYDFRDYARASLDRRIRTCLRKEDLDTISGLQERVLHGETCMQRLLDTISVDVTAMFRDPRFYACFRAKVVPLLRTSSYIRVWHAGCAGGHEAYSMAILLKEEGLHERARLYATDMNDALLHEAKAGIMPLKDMQDYTTNYLQAGGARDFSDYYTAKYDHAMFRPELQEHIVWAQHNLATDASFNEFQVILCRNVMIYFNKELQTRVHQLIYESLAEGGILALGSKESLEFSPHQGDYQAIDAREKIFRKIG